MPLQIVGIEDDSPYGLDIFSENVSAVAPGTRFAHEAGLLFDDWLVTGNENPSDIDVAVGTDDSILFTGAFASVSNTDHGFSVDAVSAIKLIVTSTDAASGTETSNVTQAALKSATDKNSLVSEQFSITTTFTKSDTGSSTGETVDIVNADQNVTQTEVGVGTQTWKITATGPNGGDTGRGIENFTVTNVGTNSFTNPIQNIATPTSPPTPLLAGDPKIVVGPDKFYITGSGTGEWSSTDGINWAWEAPPWGPSSHSPGMNLNPDPDPSLQNVNWFGSEMNRIGSTWIYVTSGNRDYPTISSTYSRGAIFIATAPGPNGPWTWAADATVMDKNAVLIDPSIFLDPSTGRVWLLYSSDTNNPTDTNINEIRCVELDPNNLTAQRNSATAPTVLLSTNVDHQTREQTTSVKSVIEGPQVVYLDQKYHLFYAAGSVFYDSTTANHTGAGSQPYTFNVATATSFPLSNTGSPRFVKGTNPILSGSNAWALPGHGGVFKDGAQAWWCVMSPYPTNQGSAPPREDILMPMVYDSSLNVKAFTIPPGTIQGGSMTGPAPMSSASNVLPTMTWLNPHDGDTFTDPTSIQLNVNVTDPDSDLPQQVFYTRPGFSLPIATGQHNPFAWPVNYDISDPTQFPDGMALTLGVFCQDAVSNLYSTGPSITVHVKRSSSVKYSNHDVGTSPGAPSFLYRGGKAHVEAVLARMHNDVGMKWLRVPVYPGSEPMTSDIFAAAADNSIKVIAVWVPGSGINSTGTPTDAANWVNALYGSYSGKFHALEIGNEMNAGNLAPNYSSNGGAYVAVMQAAYTASRNHDSGGTIPVLIGGLSSFDNNTSGNPQNWARAFLNQAQSNGSWPFDGWCYHPYDGIQSPFGDPGVYKGTSSTATTGITGVINLHDLVIAKFAGAPDKIWNTEFGYAWGPGSNQTASAATLANYFNSIMTAWRNLSYTGPFLPFSLDGPPGSTGDETTCGIIDPNDGTTSGVNNAAGRPWYNNVKTLAHS